MQISFPFPSLMLKENGWRLMPAASIKDEPVGFFSKIREFIDEEDRLCSGKEDSSRSRDFDVNAGSDHSGEPL